MNAAVISFTAIGAERNAELTALLKRKISCTGYSFYKYTLEGQTAFRDVRTLTEVLFSSCELLIFIGAAGIAVRATAPYIKEKDRDPAVLVMDEYAVHVISLLSGHLGGANDWCKQIALLTGAEPVITTATDLNGVFAVDLFARENGLAVEQRNSIKEVSGRLLHGEEVGFYSELPWEGTPPVLLVPCEKNGEAVLRPLPSEGRSVSLPECGIVISAQAQSPCFPVTCRLIPKDLTIGIGCKKGIPREEISEFLDAVLEKYGLEKSRIARFASVSLKENEPGIRELAFSERVPFLTFSAQELEAVPGSFDSSGFVKNTVGVGNVCERAAVLGSGGGELLIPKQAGAGITIAAAQRMPSVRFTQQV